MESKIEIKSNKDDVNTHIQEITNHLSKVDEEIKALKKRGNYININWIKNRLDIKEVKKIIQERGSLKNSMLLSFTDKCLTIRG